MSLFPLVKARMIFHLHIPALLSHKEVFVNKIICIVSALALSSFTHHAIASNELCLASTNDCTFVLLSTKVSEKTSELVNQITSERTSQKGGSPDEAKVVQASSYVEESEKLLLINEKRAKRRLSPFSTFKITNSLIALDSKQITNAQQTLTFDQNKYPVQAWWPSVWKLPEYNLATAFKFSMVAIYRQMARDIGQEKMQSYVLSFDYGNKDISSGLDSFWLNGSLKISAIEQVRFLQKMHRGELAISQNSIDTLKEVMLVETNTHYSLYAKTGAGKANADNKSSKAMLGWYVGFVENADGVHYFAFNFTRDSYAQMKASRVDMARNHLKKAGIIK
jgi:beta-lactamase class D